MDVLMENRLSLETLKERYKEATCFVIRVVLGRGRLGTETRDEVIHRRETREVQAKVINEKG